MGASNQNQSRQVESVLGSQKLILKKAEIVLLQLCIIFFSMTLWKTIWKKERRSGDSTWSGRETLTPRASLFSPERLLIHPTAQCSFFPGPDLRLQRNSRETIRMLQMDWS